jgi:hypothetical protein
MLTPSNCGPAKPLVVNSLSARHPTFSERKDPPAVAHLLTTVNMRRLSASASVTSCALSLAVDADELENVTKDNVRKSLAAGTAKLTATAEVNTARTHLGRIYTASLFVVKDPNELREALNKAYRAGLLRGARAVRATADDLMEQYHAG